MSVVAPLASFLGGLGLFLLGIHMMTDGLKLAAGNALTRILGQWTRTPMRGLLAGALVTSVVRSSSAVTVATIGFVNAGLLTLAPAVWVIFGSNVGTTSTAWLVALLGFKVKIEAFALPAIGIGVLLRLTGARTRRGPLGEALAGFGLLFLGLEVMMGVFSGLGDQVDLSSVPVGGVVGNALFVLVGAVLTVLVQSSSAALAVGLAASAGGVIPLEAGAAVVIGANVGTTSTALFAVIGATPGARRVAAAHVAFNLLSALVALLIVGQLVSGIESARESLGHPSDPAVTLAVFHTIFNLLGLLIMWPLAGRLIRWLETRFRTEDEDEGLARHLDENVLVVPAVAYTAMLREVERVGALAIRATKGAISAEGPSPGLSHDRMIVDRLVLAIAGFASRLQRASLDDALAEAVPRVLLVSEYYRSVVDAAVAIAEAAEVPSEQAPEVRAAVDAFHQEVVGFLATVDPSSDHFTGVPETLTLEPVDAGYDRAKDRLLKANVEGRIPPQVMISVLARLRQSRRAAREAMKAAAILVAARPAPQPETAPPVEPALSA